MNFGGTHNTQKNDTQGQIRLALKLLSLLLDLVPPHPFPQVFTIFADIHWQNFATVEL